MKHSGLFGAFGFTLAVAGLQPPVVTHVPEAGAAAEQASQGGTQRARPIKVLIRRTYVNTVAFDGAEFLDRLDAAARARPQLLSHVDFDSAASFTVVREERNLHDGEAPRQWKTNDAAFEFLLEWNVENVELVKYSPSGPVQVRISENWTVKKVSDSTVTNSWKASYQVMGGGMGSSNEKKDRFARDEAENVVAPVRSPILQEIQAFMKANRTQK